MLAAASRTLKVGDEVDPDALSLELEDAGYAFEHEVNAKGEAVRRGGLIDLWPPDQPHPLRVEFFGDEIESIRSFEPGSQRSFEQHDQLLLAPA